jgi:aspartyl aminopeptidase
MNREINKGIELNKQKDMLPIAGMIKTFANENHYFLEYLAGQLEVKKEDILEYDLMVYCCEPPCCTGLQGELLSSPRLDNITSVAAVLAAVTQAGEGNGIQVAACFDHEEIGSSTKQGAASMLLRDILEKIKVSMGVGKEEFLAQLYGSMYVSADVAHAMHPNKTEKTDLTNRPILNGGVCIKESGVQSYATDCEAIAIVEQLCRKYHIPYQKYVNRSDVPGGSTLGALAARYLPVKGVDVGVPLLAMHSARELMGRLDEQALKDLIQVFYEA